MPNADSPRAMTSRYIDITHQTLYNANSLEQILLTNGFIFSQVSHYNTTPAVHSFLKKVFHIIHPFFLLLTRAYNYGMGYMFPRVYTTEILSIITK